MIDASVFYLAACSETDPAGGIYRCRVAGDGVEQLSFSPLSGVGYLALGPGGDRIYAVCSREGKGAAAAFRVDDGGRLELMNIQDSAGRSTCHLAVSADGKFLYTANYATGTISEFPLGASGELLPLSRQIVHRGSGPNRKRQESAHPHYLTFTPDGKFLMAVDLGCDAIMCYPWHPGEGIDPAGVIENPIRPAGSGPRHLVFDASGRILYIVMELGNAVMSAAISGGVLTPLESRSTLPERQDGRATKAAAIRLSPDGRFLFATNRGYDSIAVFALDGKGGMEPADMVSSGGESPRDFDFLPGGRMAAATNEFTDNAVFFDYDARNGRLTRRGPEFSMPDPLNVFRPGKR